MEKEKAKEDVSGAILFEFVMNHNLMYGFKDGKFIFDVDEQQINITRLAIYPDLELTQMSALAHYEFKGVDNANADAIIDATRYIRTPLTGTASVTTKTLNNPKPTVKAEEVEDKDTKGKKDKDAQDEDKKKVNESTINNIKEIVEANISVITDSLKISKQIQLKPGSKVFTVDFKPHEIAKFINFRESKKIKIFINGVEKRPMEEKEFISRILPSINLEITLK
jgi:hypothetical protein